MKALARCGCGRWLVLLLLLATSSAAAQTLSPAQQAIVVENARRGLHDRFDGVLVTARPDVGKRIGLTDEQARQIDEAFRELAIARYQATRASQTARITREQFPNNGASKDEIKDLRTEAERLREVCEELEVSIPRRIEELLTDEQKKKLAEIRPPEMQAVRMDFPAEKVRDVLVSPDGTTLAVADYVDVRLYRLRGNELLHTLKPDAKEDDPSDPSAATTMAFSADGKTLAVTWYNRFGPFDVTYWNVADGALMRSHQAPEGARFGAVFSNDLSLVAGRTDNNALKVWRGDTGALVWSVEKLGRTTECLGFSADVKQLYVGLESGALSIRNAADGTEQRQVKLFDQYKYQLAWPGRMALSPDGKLVATRSASAGYATFFSVETGKEEKTVAVIGKSAYWATFVDDGDAFVVHSNGGIVVWDLKRQVERAIYTLGAGPDAKGRISRVSTDAAGRVFVAIIEQPSGKQVFRITE
jgi:Spy/CpxP family protein refolding chaperone